MRGRFFDEVADLYDRARPGYPDALVDEVLAFARLRPGDRVLEIGCGTGQATVPFASRGLRMVCLEPGPNLAELARQRLAPFEGVEVRCEPFEKWRLEPEAFGLVIAARALHWVKPRARYAKTARALRPGGALAIFQNDMLEGDPAVDAAIRKAAGAVSSDWGPREKEFGQSAYFETLTSRAFEWTQEYDASAYADLLRTQNRFRDAPEHLLVAVREAIAEHGGRITVRYVTRLLMAHRARKIGWWRRRIRSEGGPGAGATSPSP